MQLGRVGVTDFSALWHVEETLRKIERTGEVLTLPTGGEEGRGRWAGWVGGVGVGGGGGERGAAEIGQLHR